jgi:hypothetical protein
MTKSRADNVDSEVFSQAGAGVDSPLMAFSLLIRDVFVLVCHETPGRLGPNRGLGRITWRPT